MKMKNILLLLSLTTLALLTTASAGPSKNYERARWDPIHFKPVIAQAKDEQCLACHGEILQRKPRKKAPSGLSADQALAWYQTRDSYQGEQETFHRRHLVTPLAKKLMKMKCNTCHEGHDGDKEVSSDVSPRYWQPALRKDVDPQICLMCHGAFDYKIMAGLAGPWEQVKQDFNDDCMVCHQIFRTNAHNVNYLNRDAIEQEGKKDGEICFGCHGGRSWYRISYPYARNPWPDMPEEVPDWAKNRPTRSQQRFLTGLDNTRGK